MTMDSFEFTKLAGAVLSALLLIFGTRTIIEMTVGHTPEKPGFTLPAAAPAETATPPAGGAAAPAAPAEDSGKEVIALLPKANAEKGKTIFKRCQACHVSEKGQTPTVGPNLWDVVNRKKGSYPGFKYSAAMEKKGGDWSFDDLAHFLHSPKTFIPGTKMTFNGLPTPQDEADVIAYLATLADTPVPLPK
ncbi:MULTISPECIES: cytochrome c family protein [unclassified Hyphomicrobium]|uniref:c-type cytochrome n=1 Tax=unclassified Hyphomicrobium TaxID=2619925 RepID=UPI000213DF05|nr:MULTISPECIES: cytochrome c family protein [unclassified Hyphomicrobium]CCB63864.1 Cytochrome c homolog [Hyphomicrobium sp. MC1]